MKHIIVLKDNTKACKVIFALAKELAKKSKSILLDRAALKALEDFEDKFLVKEMEKAQKQPLLSPKQKATFLKKLQKS